MENIENELNKIEVSDLLTSNDDIDKIQNYDLTVEIIGFIDGMESSRIVGNNQQYKLFKFYLNNESGRRVQVVAWNDEIDRILVHVRPNYIIHLDGVQARPPKVSAFNNGTTNFELLIKSHNQINNLGEYKPQQNFEDNPQLIKMTDLYNSLSQRDNRVNYKMINSEFSKQN
ncbi:hypothetical protein PUN28_003763 [Cardiocondyla obscurior]|uniref:Single-stranded DNA binding protein n=1 Tax=Cardiocondyla obscurior TaxID=286306 RepID=A0AAW2GNH6_9HYME